MAPGRYTVSSRPDGYGDWRRTDLTHLRPDEGECVKVQVHVSRPQDRLVTAVMTSVDVAVCKE